MYEYLLIKRLCVFVKAAAELLQSARLCLIISTTIGILCLLLLTTLALYTVCRRLPPRPPQSIVHSLFPSKHAS